MRSFPQLFFFSWGISPILKKKKNLGDAIHNESVIRRRGSWFINIYRFLSKIIYYTTLNIQWHTPPIGILSMNILNVAHPILPVSQPKVPVAQHILLVVQHILLVAPPILSTMRIRLTQFSWDKAGTELGNNRNHNGSLIDFQS